MHRKANMSYRVSSRSGCSGDRAGGSVDQVDDDGVRGVTGLDRGDGFLPAHAHAGGVARAAGLGRGADPVLDGRDDRGSVHHVAGRLAFWQSWRGAALGTLGGRQRGEPCRHVAVAEPTATGRVIAAWPSFALIAAYELLMRQVRRNATGGVGQREPSPRLQPGRLTAVGGAMREPGQSLAGPHWPSDGSRSHGTPPGPSAAGVAMGSG